MLTLIIRLRLDIVCIKCVLKHHQLRLLILQPKDVFQNAQPIQTYTVIRLILLA